MCVLVFVFNLVQDVAVHRPLVHFARARRSDPFLFLVTAGFVRRDVHGGWQGEVAALARDVQAEVASVTTVLDAVQAVGRARGMVFAASESNLAGHDITHQIHQALAGRFLTVTLQHGVECVGFLHSAAHDRAHGRGVRFAAELLAGWSEAPRLTALLADQRPKLLSTGPTLLLPEPETDRADPLVEGGPMQGLLCENLHSVRFAEAARRSFLDGLELLAARLAEVDGWLHLRPHPGGRFTEKAKVALPANVVRNTLPLYRQDLSRFRFAVSGPSTILLDTVLAGVPTAVWADPDGRMDLRNWAHLPVVRSAEEIWAFATNAMQDPGAARAAGAAFLAQLQVPSDVAARYATLLEAA